MTFREYIDDTYFKPYNNIEKQEFFILAEEFAQSTENPDNTKQNVYPECFDLIEEGKQIIALFLPVLRSITTVKWSDYYEIKRSLKAMEKLIDFREEVEIPESSKQFDTRLRQKCKLRKYFPDLVREKSDLKKASIVRAREALFDANTFLIRWFDIVGYVGIKANPSHKI